MLDGFDARLTSNKMYDKVQRAYDKYYRGKNDIGPIDKFFAENPVDAKEIARASQEAVRRSRNKFLWSGSGADEAFGRSWTTERSVAEDFARAKSGAVYRIPVTPALLSRVQLSDQVIMPTRAYDYPEFEVILKSIRGLKPLFYKKF